MINIKTIIAPENVFARCNLSSKKKAFQFIAEQIGQQNPATSDALYEAFIEREKLGSTGIGNGIAIPHCRSDKSESLQAYAFSCRQSIDFDSADREGVDLIFAVVAPSQCDEAHLKALAHIAELLQKPEAKEKLCACESNDALWQQIQELSQ